MVSTRIVFPEDQQSVSAAADVAVAVSTRNLAAGFFSNATTQYYVAPQTLGRAGTVQGHQHITIQSIDSLHSAADFVFFKGFNDRGSTVDGLVLLTATVPKGTLARGKYRLCTLTGAATHQPVIMSAMVRGPQDDCVRFTVV